MNIWPIRTEAAHKVEQARIMWLSRAGQSIAAIAKELRLDPDTVRKWLKRFKTQGLPGLEDAQSVQVP